MMTDPFWPEYLIEDPHRCPDKAERVREMFNRIAPRYDLANTIISLGLAKYCRARLIRYVQERPQSPERILDICAGPGSISRMMARKLPGCRVVAADFAFNMLKTAQRYRLPTNLYFSCADGLRLPFQDNTFDVVTCAYGLRNLQDLERGLAEMHRVLKPGGRLAALDFQLPKNRLFRPLFRLYFTRILPLIGSIVTGTSRDGPYKYLPCSVATWYDEPALVDAMIRVGFSDARSRRLGLGTVILLSGEK